MIIGEFFTLLHWSEDPISIYILKVFTVYACGLRIVDINDLKLDQPFVRVYSYN